MLGFGVDGGGFLPPLFSKLSFIDVDWLVFNIYS